MPDSLLSTRVGPTAMPDTGKHRIVLDCMGADKGPAEIVTGGIDAAKLRPNDLELILVGQQEILSAALKHISHLPNNVRIEHAPSIVSMEMAATDGVRVKDSSISIGMKLLREGKADAFVSPGNTGAVMATALFTLGRIEGVSRPAIATMFPTTGDKPTILLDAGANADCKPSHLSQFAVMGSVYASLVFNTSQPKVGLLSIGEERSKGNELILETQQLLKTSQINFAGNVEGRDILAATVDVVVTDGFTGNIVLKFAESLKPFLFKKISHQVKTNLFSRFAVLLMSPFIGRLKKTFDYAEAGGAPLLGVNGNVIICHGSSNARAITNAVTVAYNMTTKQLVRQIRDELVTNHFGMSHEPEAKSADSSHRVVFAATADDQR